jgi:hypothetical protein
MQHTADEKLGKYMDATKPECMPLCDQQLQGSPNDLIDNIKHHFHNILCHSVHMGDDGRAVGLAVGTMVGQLPFSLLYSFC